jgi:hypothetical protein
MKALGLGIAFLAFLASAPTQGSAQTDVAGDWLIEVTSEPGGPNMHLRLLIHVSHVDQSLTATGLLGPDQPFTMSGSVDGSAVQLMWEPDFQFGGTPFGLSVAGTVDGNLMSGSARFDVGELFFGGEWFATREARDGA